MRAALAIIVTALGTVLFSSNALAKCDAYGNCYNVSPNYSGGYRVQGFNMQNGSNWSATVDQRGQRGFDAGGNYYSYDRNSGNYYNYGTGKMCTGKGAARVCF